MEAGFLLRFNTVLERFVPSCSSLSNAVMRMARIALYEPLVSLGLKVSFRAERASRSERVRGARSLGKACFLRVKELSSFERGRPLPPSEGNVSKSLTLKTERFAKPLTVAV